MSFYDVQHRDIVEKDFSSSPKGALHCKKQSMTKAGRKNQALLKSVVGMKSYNSAASFSNEAVNHGYDSGKKFSIIFS